MEPARSALLILVLASFGLPTAAPAGGTSLHWSTQAGYPFLGLRVTFDDLRPGDACSMRFGIAGEGPIDDAVSDVAFAEVAGHVTGLSAGESVGPAVRPAPTIPDPLGLDDFFRNDLGFNGGYAVLWDWTAEEFAASVEHGLQGRVSIVLAGHDVAPEPSSPLPFTTSDPPLGPDSAVLDLDCEGPVAVHLSASRQGTMITHREFDDGFLVDTGEVSVLRGASARRAFSAEEVHIVAQDFHAGAESIFDASMTLHTPAGCAAWDLRSPGVLEARAGPGEMTFELDRARVATGAGTTFFTAIGWTAVASFDDVETLPAS